MRESYMTKEEKKAIKKGYAYKRWQTRRLVVMILAMSWFFGGIPLAHMDGVAETIYIVGAILALAAEFWALVLTCWSCPKCKTKLPARTISTGRVSVMEPVLVTSCPHCRLDLTKSKTDKEQVSK